MKLTAILSIIASIFVAQVSCAADQQEAIKLAQEWAFALGASVKAQAKAGVKDPKAIKKKATEDTQPQERKLRAAMKEIGSTQHQIDKGIKDDREGYLDSFIEEFVRK
jgi:hypothetical protein